MFKRTYESEIIAIALLYRKKYIGTDILSYEKAIKYDSIINNNLAEMKSSCNTLTSYESLHRLYNIMQDEEGKLYAVINPNADLKRAWEIQVGLLPSDIIIASQMENALDVIGLQLANGKLIKKSFQKCCATCTYNISAELLENIIKENKEYQDLTYEEAEKKIGTCEFGTDIKTLVKSNYCCEKYLPD